MIYNGKMAAGSSNSACPAHTEAAEALSDTCSPTSETLPMAPGRGTFFDEKIAMPNPEGEAFTARILEIFDEARPRKRKRGRKALALRIHKLAANAMRGHFYRQISSVLYFRKADSPWYKDKPSWMKHGSLAKVVNTLKDAGLVRTVTGKKMPYYSDTRSWASSYTPTEKFIQIALECGVSAESIGKQIPANELIQLFGPKGSREYDWTKGELVQPRKGPRIKFEPTTETMKWVVNLEAINAFYRKQEVTLDMSPEELAGWVTKLNADPERKGASYRLPELLETDIYRVFNNGEEANPSFGEGGRLFGGWWMSIPGNLREAITINGQQTVEFDYAECHPRMLYHKADLKAEGELYILPELEAYEVATGVAPRTYRPLVKWLMQVLINGKGRPQTANKPDHVICPPDLTILEVVKFIEIKHQLIANTFKTGAGLELMRLESDIALEIITTAMTEGWTVLPVHDSFITTIDQSDRLRTLMVDAYVKRLGMEPLFK